MGPKITSAKEFALEFKDYISTNAMRGKELRSVAKSIGYSLNSFLTSSTRVNLTNELAFLNAFLGTIAIKWGFEDCPEFPKNIVDEIVETYKRELIKQWLPDFMFSEFQKRLEVWGELFQDLSSGLEYQEDLTKLASTFYEFLTKNPCNPKNEIMLTMRFNSYLKLQIGTIKVMIQDLRL
jgi:hypothetical protein